MLFIVTTTGRCNLRCRYCGGSFDEKYVPYTVKYDVDRVANLINSYEDATVVYYGGEPLLNHSFISELNSRIRGKRIGIQTNGTLVKYLDDSFWNDFHFALISIDGDEHITDKNRGRGVYRKAVEAAIYLKSMGIDTVARMTVTQESDIFRDVMYIYGLDVFDRIHWQLDAVWDERWDIRAFADKSYLPGLKKLMDFFMGMAENGEIVGIVPFLGILNSYYFEPYSHFPCGAGKSSITINSDGKVLACPIAVDYDWNYLGDIDSFRFIEGPDCGNCTYFRHCGGRCLFSYREKYWGWDGFDDICYVTKKTIDIVLERTGELDSLIERGVIERERLRYDATKDSTEVIP